jgi:hypothetical protein
MDDHIAKPFTVETLRDALERWGVPAPAGLRPEEPEKKSAQM